MNNQYNSTLRNQGMRTLAIGGASILAKVRPVLPSTTSTLTVLNPKRGVNERSGLHAWLPYYAGFSENFVASILAAFNANSNSVVLDPMNGSGTTTTAAQRCGIPSIGIEMNPAMAAVARGKSATFAHDVKLNAAISEVIKRARASKRDIRPTPDIIEWLSRNTYEELRSIESAIARLRRKPSSLDNRLLSVLRTERQIDSPDTRANFLTAVLLLTLRQMAKITQSKNPTWVKPATHDTGNDASAYTQFFQIAQRMLADLRSTFPEPTERQCSLVITGDARSMPVRDACIDLIITSPPYLTRIDYAVTTAPEIAFLGYSTKDDFHRLRRTIMGSTCISGGSYETPTEWGRTCLALLRKIKTHSSKASAGYYFKNFVQYFRDAEAILREYLRVLSPNSPCVLVLQDSWYKDVHVPLTKIYAEMAESLGAVGVEVVRTEQIRNHMGLINTRARKYQKGALREHVLLFYKG